MSRRCRPIEIGRQRPHWLLAFTALFSRSGSPTTRAAVASKSADTRRLSRRHAPDPTGRAATAGIECWCQPAPPFRAASRGHPACGATDETTERRARVKQRAAGKSDPGPLPLARPGSTLAVDLGRGQLRSLGRPASPSSLTDAVLDRPARLPLRRRQTRRDQQRRQPLRARRRRRDSRHVARARRASLNTRSNSASAASPAPAPWYRSTTVRPSSRLAAFGCSSPLASCASTSSMRSGGHAVAYCEVRRASASSGIS